MHVKRQISRSSVQASPPYTIKWMLEDIIKTQHFSNFDPRAQYIPEILCILKYFNLPKHMVYKFYSPSGMFYVVYKYSPNPDMLQRLHNKDAGQT